jgi:TolB-like protein/DNA-binding winged helix-turn-helix (wHTH) protein/Flp pilus assembly protein TadD
MNERFARAGAIAQVDLAREPEFALGSIRIRPAHCELVGAGWSETLEPRVMQVLVALARAHGKVVSRDDLIEACWEGRIVGEDSIGRCIARLRKAAEASGHAFALETVSRVGYRLKIADSASPAPHPNGSATPKAVSIAADTAAPPPPAQLSSPVWSPRSLAAVAAGMLVVLMTGFGIWWLRPRPAAAPAEPATSVAVLPFVNMSGDPAKEYFSDGFSEELLNDLSADPRLRVVARTSAFAFKGKNGDTQAIARALHVHDIVEGSVREMGNRVRITAQLIDAGDGYSIWSASYDRNLADILSVQGAVARAVAVALTHRIIPFASHPPTIDPAVYRLYLEGRQQLDQISPEGYAKAYPLLKEVARRDPRFADGLAAFSHAAWEYSEFDPLHHETMDAEAKDAAVKALQLDPENIEARELQGSFKLEEWNWKAAAADFRRLRAESPNHLRVLRGLRVYYRAMGFPIQAVAVMERALSLDPLSDALRRAMIIDLPDAHRYREAIAVGRAILAHHPDDPWGLVSLCQGYAPMGEIGEARRAFDRLRHLKSDSADGCEFTIDVYSGDIADARAILVRWTAGYPDKFLLAADIAESFVAINDFDKASDWFERAYDRREKEVFGSTYRADDAKYHQTARWQALTQRPGFKEWQAEHDRIAAELAARGGAP